MHRLRLDGGVFERETNAYLVLGNDEEPTTLIDTGIGTAAAEQSLRDALASHSVTIEDIDQLFVTHFHYDHCGLASRIQRESGATVLCHSADEPFIATDADGLIDRLTTHDRVLDRWGVPEPPRHALQQFLETSAELGGGTVDVSTVGNGETLTVGTKAATVCHLPGHTAGQIGLEFANRQMVVGDAMLPTTTPNVGGDIRCENPLADFLMAIRRIVDADPDIVWPGHGEPIRTPVERANAICNHHRHRAGRMLDALTPDSFASPWTVAGEVFGDLSGIHVLNGTGEAAAHLTFLATHDLVDEEDGRYRRLADRGLPDELFPEFD